MTRQLTSVELFHDAIRDCRQLGYIVSTEEKARIFSLTSPVLSDNRFFDTPGSRTGKHHFYRGGLATHTYQVLTFALASAYLLEEMGALLDYVVLISAAVWHDWGKLDEYVLPDKLPAYGINFEEGSVGKNELITSHHITRAAARIATCRWGGSAERIDDLLHAVEAHHGRRDWGSPHAPKTLEAMLIHQADMLSAMADAGDNPTNRS